KKSILWKYFIRTEIGGRCKMCQTEVKTSGNTINLINHLKRKHKKVLKETSQINKLKKRRMQCKNVISNFMKI
ncbi:hypothetical protein ALC62_01462, partial [Cyphomyrmex costatus]